MIKTILLFTFLYFLNSIKTLPINFLNKINKFNNNTNDKNESNSFMLKIKIKEKDIFTYILPFI